MAFLLVNDELRYKIVTTLIPTEDKLYKVYSYLCDMKIPEPNRVTVYTNTLLHEGCKSNLEFMTKIFGKNIQALILYTLIYFFFLTFSHLPIFYGIYNYILLYRFHL